MSSYINKLKYFRDYFINQIRQKFPNSKINGSLEQRLPGNCNLCFSNINSGELLLKLDAVGICASGGSACSSGDTAPSHVLSAIGVPNELARGALRVTFGDFNTFEDVEFLIKNLEEITKNKNHTIIKTKAIQTISRKIKGRAKYKLLCPKISQ